MPNRPSGFKNLRKSIRRKTVNDKRLRALKLAVKGFKTMIVDKKIAEAQKALPALYQAIDKAAKGAVIAFNNADRKKARLTTLLNKQVVNNQKTQR